jgi:hypothetical protein
VPATTTPIVWTATIGPMVWATWYNAQSSGPLAYSAPLTVTGSGLAASTSYQALFNGYDSDSPPPLFPNPTPTPPPSGPINILAGNFNVPSGGSAVLNTAPIPLVIGSSLEVTNAFFSAGSGRLSFQWFLTNPGLSFLQTTFDMGINQILNRWIIPVLAPWLNIVASSPVATNPSTSLTVTAGNFALSSLPPVLPAGMLFNLQAINVAAGGNSITYYAPPYWGPATVSLSITNPAGPYVASSCEAEIQSQIYSDAGPSLHTMIVADQSYAGGARGASAPKSMIFPPQIVSVIFRNGDTTAHNFYLTATVPT